jgi:GAF domain-containing protein
MSPTPAESAPPVAAPLLVAVTPASLSAPDGKSDPQAAAIPLTREKTPSQPSAARSSKPRMAAVRRRAGEDLIGELFETMHDLHFMRGVADGAEFMLAAVESIVPCDGVLIHVFDINTRQFVVVRAKGPGTMQVLLHRTPDTDPFFNAVMRRPGSVAIHDVASDPRVLGPRWDTLGVKPVRALCGPVRQGGRYLGLLEVVNPLGDAPFHQTEQNAIDYICEQFAEFLVNRPIVLEADVILKR